MMATKKPFQIRRTLAVKAGTVFHKHSETEVQIPQLFNNALNDDDQRAYLNDVTPDTGTTSDDKRVINNEKLPRSAPLSHPKRSQPRGDLKGGSKGDKKNSYFDTPNPYSGIKNKDFVIGSYLSRANIPASDDAKKNMNGVSRTKKLVGKPLIIVKKTSSETRLENVNHVGLEIEGFQLKNIERRDESVSEEKGAISGREGLDGNENIIDNPSKYLEFTLAGFSPPKIVDEVQEEDCVEENEQRPNVDEVSETKDCRDSALGGSEYEENQNRNSVYVRGIFAKEHIPVSELQKQNDQKRLMKEYLDSQLNEKKMKKEEEKRREMEYIRKEEDRIKKDIMLLEQRFEKESLLEMGKNYRSQTIEPPNEQGSPRSTTKPINSGRSNYKLSMDNPMNYKNQEIPQRASATPDELKNENLANSNKPKSGKTKVETVQPEKENPEKSGQETEKVEKLTVENKQLRDENNKKKEIIDILISALKQKEQGVNLLNSDQPVPGQRNSPSIQNSFSNPPLLEDPNELARELKAAKTYDNIRLKYNASLQDLNLGQNLTPFEERHMPAFYNRKPEVDIYTDAIKNASGVNNAAPEFINNMASPGKRNVYKIFLPQRKEMESSHSIYRSDFSPRISQLSRNHVHSSGPVNIGAYVETIKSTTTKAKSTFLPGLAGPSIPQASSYKPNLISNGEQIVNNGVKMGDLTLRREDIYGKDRDLTKTFKQSKSDANLLRTENVLRMMADTPVKQKNYNDAFYTPNVLSSGLYNPHIFNGKNKEEVGIQQSIYIKGDYSNRLVDELLVGRPRNKSGSFKDKDLLKPMVKTPGPIIGLNAITVVDMAENNGRQRPVERVSLIDGEGVKLYSRDSAGGISARVAPVQFNDNKGKFPKEVFTSNVKKKFCG